MIVASICARGGSKGISRKNLLSLNGKPLLQIAIECAKASSTIDEVIISTDVEEIAELGRKCGALVPFMRPAELAADTSSKWDVFRHLVETYEKLANVRIDVLADLDVGVPLRLPEDVDGCVRALQSMDVDVVTTVYEAERNPYFNMVQIDDEGLAHVVVRSPAPIVRRQDAPVVYSMTPAVFAIRRDALWSCRHWAESRMTAYPIDRLRAVDLDVPADLAILETASKILAGEFTL